MTIRAFAIVLLVALLAATVPASGSAVAVVAAVGVTAPSGDEVPATVTSTDDDTTQPTINEFLPEQRSLGECLGALQKPNCGSDARGGWAQTAVFAVILAGLAFIAWRIVAGSRRARREGTE